MIEDFEEKRAFTSEFNEAKFQILRLHNSWEKCKDYSHSGKLMQWNWELDNIFAELSTDAENEDNGKESNRKESKQGYTDKIKKLNELVAENKKNSEKLYLILRMKERILKRLQDVSGKGSKRKADDEDDIDT